MNVYSQKPIQIEILRTISNLRLMKVQEFKAKDTCTFTLNLPIQAFINLRGSVKCRLRTIVFRVKKQWDSCCHLHICKLKTIVRSRLRFTLTVDLLN